MRMHQPSNSAESATPAQIRGQRTGVSLGCGLAPALGGVLLLAVLLAGAGPAFACTGDCDEDGHVGTDESVRGVDIALGNLPLADCGQFDADDDGAVAVNEVVAAVGDSLDACPAATPGPTPTVTPGTDGAATLVIEQGAGNEFVTGRSYSFDLADIRAGNLLVAFYRGTVDADHRTELADLELRQTILDAGGNIVRDASGRRRIVRIQFGHVPLRTGTFHCGEAGIPALPGSLLTFDASATLRDDALFMETTLDDYFGYPQPIAEIDCTLTITSLEGGLMVGTYESHMLSAEADDLAHATGTLMLPQPTCTFEEASASPQTCWPWAF